MIIFVGIDVYSTKEVDAQRISHRVQNGRHHTHSSRRLPVTKLTLSAIKW